MLRILCVDDDADMRSLIALGLEVCEFAEVAEARDGWDAIEKARLLCPDLILMDIMMPNMNGIEAIRRLRDSDITLDMPIIVISAKHNHEIMDHALRVGANEYVTKPFVIEHLRRVIRRYTKAINPLEKLEKQRRRELSLTATNNQYAKEMEMLYQLAVWQNNPELAAHLEQLTKLIRGLIHDLRNRLGILRNYSTRADYCLWLLEGLNFLCFKPGLSPRLCRGNLRQPEIPAQIFTTLAIQDQVELKLRGVSTKEQPTQAEGITVKGLMDSSLLSRTLWLLCHHLVDHLTEMDWDSYTIHIDDKRLLDPQDGFHITVSISAQSGINPKMPYQIDSKYVLSGDKVAMALFLLRKAILLHKGELWVNDKGAIEIRIEDRLKPSRSFDHLERLRHDLEMRSKQYQGPEPNVYRLVRGFIPDIIHELEGVRAEALTERGREISQKAREMIQRNCSYTQLLLHNLLWLGVGVESPQIAVDIEDTLKTVQKIMSSEIRQGCLDEDDADETIEVRIEIEPKILAVLGDPVSLKQVFMNLITNALEAMPGRGILTLRVYQTGRQVFVEISDTGGGIPVKDVAKIFDLAFSTKQGRERGVGLHIVKSIVEKWGGSIDVITELGLGTTFRVCLQSIDYLIPTQGKEYYAITPSHINC